MSIGNTLYYKDDFACSTLFNFQTPPNYVRFQRLDFLLCEAKDANVDGIGFTRQYHLPMLRQMTSNLVGSSLVYSFIMDNNSSGVPSRRGVFYNLSDPLAYLNTEVLPMFTSELPKISIHTEFLNNSSSKFGEQFLVPFLSFQKIMCASSVDIVITSSQFCFVAIPFDPILKWLNLIGKNREFVLEIYSTESKISDAFLTALKDVEERLISISFYLVFSFV